MAKDQTEIAFMENADETVDPVSGNDVPPGSLPEEVRDDIDAKLSEGEYVVPADVVRYYGVKFFENLRTKAKQGLQQMDEDGRIGGEPTSEMSLPFDISELEVEDDDGMRMAVGGLVAEYNVGGYQQASGVGSSFGGYGGYTGYKPYDPTAPVATTTPPPVAPTTVAPTTVAMGPKIETYYRADGTPVPITFINGKPQQSTQGLTKKNPNSMDTKETYNPLEGAKLNEFGQPVDNAGNPIDMGQVGQLGVGAFGTFLKGSYERGLKDIASEQDPKKRAKGISTQALGELDKSGSFLNKLGQVVVGLGATAIAGPTAGLAAAKGYGNYTKNQNIADAMVSQMVLEKTMGVNREAMADKISEQKPLTKAEAAWKSIELEIQSQTGQNRFEDILDTLGFGPKLSNAEKRFNKLGFNEQQAMANSLIETAPTANESSPTGTQSAAQTAQNARIERAKTEWAGKPKGNPSWNQTGPTEETYQAYVNVGRQSEKITAKGQVMRTQADAYNQNRADDQSAASKRAGERAAERARAEANGENGDQAVADFNASRADEIRTKYGGNKQTDSNGEDSGGTHCCTAAQARGDMTITEVKKLRAWHREQDMFWQEGYDVWGKVIADNLVAKSKWQSDRVRDFYDHKIYGKRTVGSIYADVVIYPMSYIIGGYRVLKNTLKIKGKNYGS